MTYNVSSGTLSLYTTTTTSSLRQPFVSGVVDRSRSVMQLGFVRFLLQYSPHGKMDSNLQVIKHFCIHHFVFCYYLGLLHAFTVFGTDLWKIQWTFLCYVIFISIWLHHQRSAHLAAMETSRHARLITSSTRRTWSAAITKALQCFCASKWLQLRWRFMSRITSISS